jgi:hypothetical protein
VLSQMRCLVIITAVRCGVPYAMLEYAGSDTVLGFESGESPFQTRLSCPFELY